MAKRKRLHSKAKEKTKSKKKKDMDVRPRKDRIVKAAIECFTEYGIGNTKYKQIAGMAGVDQPLIGYYFPTADGLYSEVFEVVLRGLKKAAFDAISNNPNNPAECLWAYVRSPFTWGAKNKSLFSIWMNFYYMASFKPHFKNINDQIRITGRERIAVLIYSGIEKGIFKTHKSMSVQELAITIQGMMTGNAIMLGTENSLINSEMADLTVANAKILLGHGESSS